VTNRDRTAVDVDLGRIDVQRTVHRTGLRSKGFVEFEQVHVLGFPARTGQRLLRCRHGAHAHGGWVQTAGAKRGNAGQGLEAQSGSLLGGHDHHSGRTVVDARGVACSDAASLVKGGTQTGQHFLAGFLVDEFIGVEHQGIALALGNHHIDDFVFELASFLCSRRLALATGGQSVLHFSGNAVGLGHVFGGDAHVVLVVHVPQAVHDHGVGHLPVAHALAVAAAVQDVRAGAHVFLATGNHDFAVAPGHGLGSQHHGLQARAAHGVDGQRRGFLGHTGFHHGLAGGVLAHACGQHLAHDDFTDGVHRQAAALEQTLDDDAAQLGGGGLGERAAKFAHGGACGCNDDDVFHFCLQ
jgi:hypothetical protein